MTKQWQCKTCGCSFPDRTPLPFDEEVERCTNCVTVEAQGLRLKAFEELVKLQGKLLVNYRIGSQPSDKTLDGLERVKKKLGLT